MDQQHKKQVYTVELEGADHMGMLTDTRVLDYVSKLMLGMSYHRDYDASIEELQNNKLKIAKAKIENID